MTEAEELQSLVEQNLDSPFILGRIVSRLRKNDASVQKSKDGRSFDLFWRNVGPYWRCTIFLDEESEDALAQIDIHEDGTVRTELHEPGSITIDPTENLLVLVRFTGDKRSGPRGSGRVGASQASSSKKSALNEK